MKIELIERADNFYIRTLFLGFIPMWWDNGWEGGWEFFRCPMTKSEAEEVFERLVANSQERCRFLSTKDKVLKTLIP